MKKKISGVLFCVTFTLCGCGVENVFGTEEQRATWLALFVVMTVAAFGLKER